MKKVLSILLLALATLTTSAHATFSDNSNFGVIGVGKPSSTSTLNTYTILSGTAREYKELPLTSVLTGTNGTTALADTAITTGLCVTKMTGATNTATVFFPAELNTAVASIKHRVPWNYVSGGQLLVWCHTNTTFTAGQLSITASAYPLAPGALTSTAIALGTAVQVSTTASTQLVGIVATNSAVYLTPGGTVTWKLSKATTSNLVALEVIGLDFIYKKAGISDGQ